MAPLTEGYHTGHALRLGIVEDILETEGIGGSCVFVDVGAVYHVGIIAGGIGHGTDVTLPCQTTIGGTIATAGCNSQGEGAVVLLHTIIGMASSKDVSSGRIVATNKESGLQRVDRELIPKGFYTVGARIRRKKSGMGKVETDVLNAQDNAATRKRLRKG